MTPENDSCTLGRHPPNRAARDAAPGIGEAGQIDKKVRVVSTIEYLLGP
jgi:hypothetical protein